MQMKNNVISSNERSNELEAIKPEKPIYPWKDGKLKAARVFFLLSGRFCIREKKISIVFPAET